MYHYTNSRTSQSNDEPVFQSLWLATFVLPEAIRAVHDASLLQDQLINVSGLATDKLPELVEQKYRHISRRFGGTVVQTFVDVAMTFEANVNQQNQIIPYNIIRDWSKLIYNPATGAQGLKRDYVGKLTLELHDKAGQVVRKWHFPEIWPSTALNEMSLDYTSESIYQPTINFAADYYEDITA